MTTSTVRLETAATVDQDTAKGMMTIPPAEAATLAIAIRLDSKASAKPAATPIQAVAAVVVNPEVTAMIPHLV